MTRWSLSVLRWLVGEDQAEVLEGDMLELFEERKAQRGRYFAKLMQWYDVIDLARSFIKRRESKRYRGMNKNLLKVIARNMGRKKLLTGINLFGLAMSMLVALLVSLYVSHELSYDRYHEDADRVMRVTIADRNADGPVEHWSRVYADWVNELPEVFPQIESFVRIQNFRPRNVLVGEQKFREENAFSVDQQIFQVFDFAFVHGDEQALNQAQSVVLTESTSRKYFGGLNSLGEEVILQGGDGRLERFTVTGIVEDQPSNTHLPLTLMTSLKEEDRTGWAFVYLKVRDKQGVATLEQGLPDFVAEQLPDAEPGFTSLHLQPLTSIHLHSDLARELRANGNVSELIIFCIVALVILLVAGINFANLNTVQSLDRAREVGVRKVLGAGSLQIRRYFLLEAGVISALSGALAWVLLIASRPLFEQFLGEELVTGWGLPVVIGAVAILLNCLLGGLYPAIMLSRYRPIQALKGEKAGHGEGIGIRKVMLGWQFALSIGLISATLITQRQFEYIYGKSLGYSGDQVMAIKNIPEVTKRKYESLKGELDAIPGIAGVSALMELPTQAIRDAGFVTKGTEPSDEEAPLADIQLVDINLPEFLGLELVAGEGLPSSLKSPPLFPPSGSDFEATFAFVNERRRAYLINESAMHLLGWQDPQEVIGESISWNNTFLQLQPGPIVGVIRDFHQESLKTTIDPVVMVYDPVFFNHVLVKMEGEDLIRTLEQVEQLWNANFEEYPMEVTFLDEEFDKMYQAERQQLTLVALFSGLALIVAFFGLFGLATYTMKLRLKEMAIRKVLGATIGSTVRLFGREYLMVVIGGAAVATPIVWLLMARWLDNYAYHTNITGVSFLLSIGIILLLMGATLVSQAWRAESQNPSEILNKE